MADKEDNSENSLYLGYFFSIYYSFSKYLLITQVPGIYSTWC